MGKIEKIVDIHRIAIDKIRNNQCVCFELAIFKKKESDNKITDDNLIETYKLYKASKITGPCDHLAQFGCRSCHLCLGICVYKKYEYRKTNFSDYIKEWSTREKCLENENCFRCPKCLNEVEKHVHNDKCVFKEYCNLECIKLFVFI